VAEGTREVVLNLPDLTGGGAGITVPALGARATTAYPGNTAFYYLFLAALAVAVAVVFTLARSRFGYSLRAIHEDEVGAAATGINTTRAKLAAFALSGALTALAGALFAFQQVTIYPDRLFSVEITVLIVVMAVIGGPGTVLGPVAGAAVLQLLAEYLRQRYLNLHLILFGGLMVAVVVFMPQGVVSFLGDAWRERRPNLLDTVRRYRV
jgi:branched-chain amino acid transport system permease protein